MSSPAQGRPRVLLVAPNISRVMGGEAIKALHVMLGYRELGFEVIQVAHARVRQEMAGYAPEAEIHYVEDGRAQVTAYRLGLKWIVELIGSLLLSRRAQRLVRERQPWIVHFTSPISPSYPFFPVRGAPVVIGPLNGNLLHPPAFLHRESRAKLVGARLLGLAQLANRHLFRGKRGATLMVSGGERTVKALEMGGCTRDQIVLTLDSGVNDALRAKPRLTHEGSNNRFVFIGRLVRYKACDLVIRALRLAPDAVLEVIGDGEERAALEALAAEQGVADRVVFHGYMPTGPALFDRLATYRGFMFPTLAEANGIVIQEAMMIGLPIVAVNWGGPAQLLDADTAILLEPESEEAVVRGLAEAMTTLAGRPALAERLSRAARARAEALGFDWQSLLRDWIGLYDRVLAGEGSDRRFGDWLAERERQRQGKPPGDPADQAAP